MNRSIRSIIEKQSPVTGSANLTVAAAAKLMKSNHVGALLVVKDRQLAGIFTERDALFRVIAEGRDPGKIKLAEVMTTNPRSIAPDRPFAHALHLMYEGGFRHVPVVEEGRPIGMVSARDALAPELDAFEHDLETREHIGEVMR